MTYKTPRGEKTHLKITYSKLAKLFGKSRRTIKRWVKEGKLDPTNLENIIEKYNNPHMLDNRMKIH